MKILKKIYETIFVLIYFLPVLDKTIIYSVLVLFPYNLQGYIESIMTNKFMFLKFQTSFFLYQLLITINYMC